MKILYICVGAPFTPAMYYRENYLIDAHLQDGVEVTVLADTTTWHGNEIVTVKAGETVLENGARVIRVPVETGLCPYLGRKLRRVKDFTRLVVSQQPDVIMFNAIQQQGVNDIRCIREQLPGCKVYGIVSTSLGNSAGNPLSRYLLHGVIYRRWIRNSLPYWNKLFYVAGDSRNFLTGIYHVPEEKLELYPLPAKIMSQEEKQRRAAAFRSRYGLSPDTMVLFHSGKMDARKKTVELLHTVRELSGQLKLRLFIAGKFYEDIRDEAQRLMDKTDTVVFLGFLGQDEMQTALAACDLYLQPGSPSQTAQAAIACGTPVVVSGEKAYRSFIDGNGYLIRDPSELRDILLDVAVHPEKLAQMSERAYDIARRYFDYRTLAARLYR